ncbi:O-antigen ligase family protein, partial [Vibrio tubiashii]|uniref:O-antigen ligase family protein n=1 Tax=Vibrio tubiashii TaxID=29498 RepID=UPI001EFC9B8F
AACYALLLTNARGVWAAIPIAVLLLIVRQLSLNIKSFLLFTIVLTSLSIVSFPLIENRWENTILEYNQTIGGNYNTSLGVRLVLWTNGLDYIKSNPVFGVGDIVLAQKINEIDFLWSKQFTHLHNQYIDLSARSGVLGLVLLFFWLTSIFADSREGGKGLKVKGNPFLVSLLVMFGIASFTDVPLVHAHIVYLISIFMAVSRLLEDN